MNQNHLVFFFIIQYMHELARTAAALISDTAGMICIISVYIFLKTRSRMMRARRTHMAPFS